MCRFRFGSSLEKAVAENCRISKSDLKLFEPIGENGDHLGFVAVIEMIRAWNDFVAAAGAARLRQRFRVFREKRMLGAAGDGEMRAAKAARVRSHIVVLVLAVLVDVCCGGKKRRSAARHR